ncbi:MAG: ABC transporter ATP-binding protein [Clostridiales bacterium]|nr:ABC transporter ATP-binding protein [Clostridiales bacterium]MDY4622227.1 ABC transporter ATP-binding protein [Eubacteriales bacterium]
MAGNTANNMNEKVVLSLNDIHVSFDGNPVLNGVSVGLYPGEVLGIRGENAAGKSTLLSVMAGILRPQQGIRAAAPGAEIRIVPQDIALYPSLTGKQNLEFFAEADGFFGNTERNRVNEMLSIFNLESSAKKRVETYSGGMKRRLNMAVSLIRTPDILLLDEPTVGADTHSVGIMLGCIKTLKELGTSIVLISHNRSDLDAVCDRTVELRNGILLGAEDGE